MGGRDFERRCWNRRWAPAPTGSKSFDTGRSVVYGAVPDYWGARPAGQQGPPISTPIRYEYFRDPTVALEAFKAGRIDFRTENIAKDWATAYDFPALARA